MCKIVDESVHSVYISVKTGMRQNYLDFTLDFLYYFRDVSKFDYQNSESDQEVYHI